MVTWQVALLLKVAALPLAIPSWNGEAKELEQFHRQECGKWVATREDTLVGNPQARAQRFRQQVFRQGPEDREPVLLYEQTSTGRVGFHLRDDGLLLVQPIGPLPRLYFPRSQEPIDLVLPPQQGTDLDHGYRDPGTTWFLDDYLFYSRDMPGRRLIGFVRINVEERSVVENKVCIDVDNVDEDCARVDNAVFKAGDYVFWVNRGYFGGFSRRPPQVQSEWLVRKVRAMRMKSCELVAPEQVPLDVLRKNKERLFDFVVKQVHNRSPELEIWAVNVLAKIGTRADAEQLRALSRSFQVSTTLDEEVRATYAATVRTLEKKAN